MLAKHHCAVLGSTPANSGAQALAMVQAMLEMPAAAERSARSTIAFIYDSRIGTSIWERPKRSKSIIMANMSTWALQHHHRAQNCLA